MPELGMVTRADRWLLAGYAGIAGFGVLEGTLRGPDAAASLRAERADDGTTRALALAYGATALAAAFLRRVRPRFPVAVQPLGVALELAGLGLRAWAMETLHESYTRTLRVSNTQGVVESGPYFRIRHPGYLGSLLIWLGFALSSGSPLVLGWVTALILPIYVRRMTAEETLLSEQLPHYDEYQARTKRLVPSVW